MATRDQRQERVEFGRLSSWRESAGLDEAQAREHAARLELRARAESETAVRNEYIQMLGVAPGMSVLDVGCGSGAVTRALARRVAPGGHVVGMDASASMLKIARELADGSRVGENIEFNVGDSRALSLPSASFDCVLAATMLSHVPDPECALAEMVRVTRPGGPVGVFDVDGDLTLFSHPDRALTRRIIASFSDLGWVNGLFARRLPSVLAGLDVVNVR